MGTRSTTKINDEQGETLVTLYRQFDGYPTAHGQELADFLNGKTIINGISGQTALTHANGMGRLAALLIGHLKDGKIGDIYVTTEGDSQEYNYTVYSKDGLLYLRCESEYYGLLYDGVASDFDGVTVEGSKTAVEETSEV